MESTVVVTGAGGFIGPFVVRALERAGATVRALAGPPGQVSSVLPASVSVVNCDIIDTAAVRRLVRGADMVVHMAGAASVKQSFKAPKEFCIAHVAGTATVLDACRMHGVRRFVYLSSAEVYGRALKQVREEHSIDPRSPYGAAKVGAEHLVRSFVHAYGMEAIILRPFSVYGPGMSRDSVVGTIFFQARKKAAIKLWDLKPVRDYCHVHDLAKAILLACVADVDSPCTLNIGTGKSTSVLGLARLILRTLGRKIPIVQSGEKRPGRSENYRLVADPRRALDTLRWSSKLSLAEGLRQMARNKDT